MPSWSAIALKPAMHRASSGRRSRATGFTLLEVLIALSLLVALTALAWPALESQLLASGLPESASRIRSMLYMARSSAMFENRRVRVRFAPSEQHPYIEFEPDPINQPGFWSPVPAFWAQDPMLLDDVEVHQIRPGQPAYMKPISVNEDPSNQLTEEELLRQAELEAGIDSNAAPAQSPAGGVTGEMRIDETRPLIVFETDGSTNWATLILAKVLPSEPLNEEDDQLWIVIDGRTGLATIREQVTEAQLSDPAFYVQREKLELPDSTGPDDLTLNIVDTATSLLPQDGQGQSTFGGANGLDAGAVGLQQGGPPSSGGMQDHSGAGGATPAPGDSAQDGAEEDPRDQLERELADSDLSEEEKEEIRRSFEEGLNPR